MNSNREKQVLHRGLYVITDCVNFDTPGLLNKTELILAAGISALQYRDKTHDPALRLERALALQKLCVRYKTVFIINDDVALAAQINADGVHIGREDMSCGVCRTLLGKDVLIGVSCYNRLQPALSAEKNGADYVAFGSFYPTTTKITVFRADMELLKRASSQLTVPVAAIGGISPENGAGLVAAGADLLAVVSSIYSSTDPRHVVSEFNSLFKSGLGTRG